MHKFLLIFCGVLLQFILRVFLCILLTLLLLLLLEPRTYQIHLVVIVVLCAQCNNGKCLEGAAAPLTCPGISSCFILCGRCYTVCTFFFLFVFFRCLVELSNHIFLKCTLLQYNIHFILLVFVSFLRFSFLRSFGLVILKRISGMKLWKEQKKSHQQRGITLKKKKSMKYLWKLCCFYVKYKSRYGKN